MNKTLLVTAISLAFSLSAQAQDSIDARGSATATQTTTRTTDNSDNSTNDNSNSSTNTATTTNSSTNDSNNTTNRDNDSSTNRNSSSGSATASAIGSTAANNGGSATSNFSNSFNTSTVNSTSNLSGSVTGNNISNIGNVATLLRLPGLMPGGVDLAPLLREARRQLHLEADYLSEARRLTAFCDLLAGSETFRLPELQPDLSTPQVLAMSYVEGQPIEALADTPQALRDHVASRLIDLVLRELFSFGLMQTDPNLANYRYDEASRRIVLLDFGAVMEIAPGLAQDFRTLLNAALDGDAAATRAAMLRIGYFDAATAPRHQALIQEMFDAAMAPLRQSEPFDFGAADLIARLRDMGLAMGTERDLAHVPPPATLFLHRKIGGIYLLATKLRARVSLRPMLEGYR